MHPKDLLAQAPLFADLPPEALAELAAIARPREHKKDELLFSEGDEAHALYILASGVVDLVKSSPDGREQFVRRVKRGEIFAEAAMFSGIAYPATAVARGASEVLVIEKARFLALIKRNPEISLRIMGAMARLLKHLNTLVADLSLSSVAARLAQFLIDRASREGARSFELGLPKRELAFRLGTTPETLSRNLRALQDEGILQVKGRGIILKKLESLKKIASA